MYKKYLAFFLVIVAFTVCITLYVMLVTDIHFYPLDILKTHLTFRKVPDVRTAKSGNRDQINYIEELSLFDGNAPSEKLNLRNEKTHTVQTDSSYWDWVDSLLTSYGMYRESDDVEHILETMRTSEVTSVARFKKASSLKLWVILSGGQRCIFKPFLDIRKRRGLWEVPHCEIATFHIDRLLGMRKVPYATGRVLNFRTEIFPVANKSATELFSVHANGTVCLRAKWRPFCYDNGVPGALIYYVRRELKVEWERWHPLHPWGTLHRLVNTTARKDVRVVNNNTLCVAAMGLIPQPNHTIYMDLLDLNILDYLILNLDRQYFHVMQPDSSKGHVVTLHLDHGASIRRATYDRLVYLHNLGDSFYEKMANLTRSDPLSPLVPRKLLVGIAERAGHVIDVVNTACRPLVAGSRLFV